jgi:EAL and modified HD-GYP domain-containing signal transduction protein
MAAAPFPLVEIRSVASAQNEWVALLLRAAEGGSDGGFNEGTLRAMFEAPDLLAAVAPLDCIVLLDSPAALTPPVLNLIPPSRVVLAVDARALEEGGMERRLVDLQAIGYRVLLDGPLPAGMKQPLALRGVSRNFGSASGECATLVPASLPALFGPHLARGVDSIACMRACENAGFSWFSGTYALDDDAGAAQHEYDRARHDDGTTRRRLLTMLALLARDADSRDIEAQLKQDPALSYHLLKLVNSAAFSSGIHIASFGQAISRIGRRQLQRWLQLLLYARQHPDGPPNLLLPIAARRGAVLEALSKLDGDNREQQDLAFMTGVFSLLDRLFRTPMAELLRGLNLPEDVEMALLTREGRLGQRLRLCEMSAPSRGVLDGAGIDSLAWWQSQLNAYHWAIQVARNV